MFGRTYLALVVVVVGSLASIAALDGALRRPPDRWRVLTESPVVVRDVFDHEPDERRALKEVSRRLDAETSLVGEAEALPPEVRHRLALGLPATPPTTSGPPVLFVPLPDRRVVRITPPLPHPTPWPLAGLLLVGVGLVAAHQLRPLDRALERLSETSGRLAAGDLSARAGLQVDGPAGELGARFDTMAERLGRLIAGRTELLLAVSHELRTPLQRVRFASELLADDAGPPEERAGLVERLHQDLDELDALLGELLDLGRLEAVAPDLRAVPVGPLLSEIADRCRALGAEVEVEVEATAWVRGDPTLLARALRNLAYNAVKYGHGRVRLSVGAPGVLVVEDDGTGVPEADRERVLEPFVRLEAARGRSGAGLGLALVSRIASAHGGEVVVGRSETLGGARFELHLPADGDSPALGR